MKNTFILVLISVGDVFLHDVAVAVARNKVAIPNSHQTEETKVSSVQEAPALPGAKQQNANQNVSEDDNQGGRPWHHRKLSHKQFEL